MKTISINDIRIDWKTCEATGGGFVVNDARYDGNWVQAIGYDTDSTGYRVIWTDVEWDSFLTDASTGADWDSPNYILDDYGYCVFVK